MPAARKKAPAGPRPGTRVRAKPAAGAPRAVAEARSSGSAPEAVEDSLPQALRVLREVTESLQYAHQSFADAQLQMPRAEDYEPLAEPLREFARVSPSLVEALRELVQVARPLAALVDPLTAAVRQGAEPVRSGKMNANAEALRRVEAAREAVIEALAGLPQDSDYAPVAAQLRELASVSPSLMEWLREVPKLSTPLARSVQALRRAAADLGVAGEILNGG